MFSDDSWVENAEFVRYGVMHRNSFMNSPELLKPTYQSTKREDLFFAGQMTGVEGYVESAASGLLAGINAARLAKGNQSSFHKKQLLEVWLTTLLMRKENISNR